ncbi:MAG: gliding motility-associated C-terminal domain-containing protein, partial [Bacteroidia bacterium]|nr:gliding motility-associated C-terminal domain-containing protein [Bacteroidia bacterium]
ITYTWSPTTGLKPTSGVAQNVVATVNPSMMTSIIYTVVASNPYGCVSTNTITLPINQFPSPSINPYPSTTLCAGFTATLTGYGAISYTWSGPGTFSTPVVQQSVAVQTPGQYTLVASNGGGCIATTYTTITPGSDLNITVTPPNFTTCIASNFPKFSQPVHLTASGASSYVWFPYDPLHMTYSLGPQTDVSPAASTCYTVIGTTSVCSGSAQVCGTVIPQYTIQVTPPQPALCLGDSLDMKIAAIGNAYGSSTAFTYSWTEALNAPPISLTEYFELETKAFPQNTTTYTVEMKDARGCVCMPQLVTVTVFPKPVTAIAIPTINNVATNTVCFVGRNPGAPDVTINLIGHNMNPALPFGVVPSYTWISPYLPKYNSILTSEFASAVIVSAPSRLLNNSPIAVYTLVTGYYGFKGCKRMDTVSIRAVDCRPVRDVYFNTIEPNDTICTRGCITFINTTDTAAGGPQEVKWEFQGGNPTTSNEQQPTVCYNLPGKYSVVLRVKNPYPKVPNDGSAPGSEVAKGKNAYVNVTDVPNVTIVTPGQLQSDTVIRFGDAINLNGSGALSYQWSPAYNISSLTKPKVTVNPFRTTQYILTGYNSRSCFSTDTINVVVIEDCGEMYVPNAFTPNNDGANDVLYVRGRCLQSLTFMVFNRWGEKVFETTDQSQGWDGTYKGEDMGTAVFVFRLEGKTYKGEAFTMKGNVTLIR